jgi:hypothetical protein
VTGESYDGTAIPNHDATMEQILLRSQRVNPHHWPKPFDGGGAQQSAST